VTAHLEPLPRLRRKRRLDLPKIVGRFSDGVAEVDAQVEHYHQQWDAANEFARRQEGPLWVALGDSSSQGVGASAWENGWTHQVLDRLRSATGETWRLINLSMSGGRFLDVANRQVPVLNTMLDEPQLVTCVIGSNDLMWRRGVGGITSDANRAIDRVPAGAFVSKLNGPGPRPKILNDIFDRGASTKDHQLFNIWNWPSGRGALAADRVHPSDIGYQHMTELAWSAVGHGLGL
jgi:lysophospholipase L1-like esterase